MVPGRDNSRTVSDAGLESVLNMLSNPRHVFALVILLITVGAVQGQRGLARPNDQAPQLKRVDSKDFREDFIKASNDYEASLQKLLVPYESDKKNLPNTPRIGRNFMPRASFPGENTKRRQVALPKRK